MNSEESKSFRGRTAVISGGLGDIGKHIAQALATRGANIALGDRLPETEARNFVDSLRDLGVKVSYTQLDVSLAEPVKSWLDECEKELGIPDVIVANAATVTLADFRQLTPEQWDTELRINLSGPFYLTKFASEKLISAQLPGHIVLVGSWAAHVVHAHIPAYSVSKAGLRMLGKCLALELAPHGILVNEVAPGYVEAGLTAQIWRTNPSLREQSESKVPTKKLIHPSEVADQVVHLCEKTNRHMTGSTLLMDGGLSLLSV